MLRSGPPPADMQPAVTQALKPRPTALGRSTPQNPRSQTRVLGHPPSKDSIPAGEDADLVYDLSGGPDRIVALLAGKVAQCLVEGDEARVRGLREGQQPAIADPFRGCLGGEWFGGLAEDGFNVSWVGTELDARVFEPAVVDGPCLAQGERPLAHDGGVGEQAQQAKLRVAGEDEAIIVREAIEPCPCIRVVGVAVDAERDPDVEVRKEQGHGDSRQRGNEAQACPYRE